MSSEGGLTILTFVLFVLLLLLPLLYFTSSRTPQPVMKSDVFAGVDLKAVRLYSVKMWCVYHIFY